MNNESDFIKVKKVLADFVEIKGGSFANLFLNDEKTLVNFIKTIDKRWVALDEEQYDVGLFSKDDKRLLLYLKDQNNLSHLNITDLSNLEKYENIKHIVIEKDSYLNLDDYKKTIQKTDENGETKEVIEQGVKLSVNDNIMKLLKFNSNGANIDINYDNTKNELLITQKKFIFESQDYKTLFDIKHNLDSDNLNVKILCRDDYNNWVDEFAKITYTDLDTISINFTEAVQCRVIISKL